MTSGLCQAGRHPGVCRSDAQENTRNLLTRTAEGNLQPYRAPHCQGAWRTASATASAAGVDLDALNGAT